MKKINRFDEIVRLMRLLGMKSMAEQYSEKIENMDFLNLSMDERLHYLLNVEYESRMDKTIVRLRKASKLPIKSATFMDYDYRPSRKINMDVLEILRTGKYIKHNKNIVVLGSCGTGKTYTVCCLGNDAIDSGIRTKYYRMSDLLMEIQVRRAKGDIEYKKALEKIYRIPLLIIDEFLIQPLTPIQIADIYEILNHRHTVNSTIICTQYDISEWHVLLGSGASADAICDRFKNGTYALELYGNSLREIYD